MIYAQAVVKPKERDKLVELRALGLSNVGAGLNGQYGGAMLRDFKSATKANRWAADLAFSYNYARISERWKLEKIDFVWGMENHLKGSDRISSYWGYDVGIFTASNFDIIGFRSGLFTGFDVYLMDGLAVGAELGFQLRVGLDPISIAFPGSGMNSALKLCYRL
jgi:hypothetical protein